MKYQENLKTPQNDRLASSPRQNKKPANISKKLLKNRNKISLAVPYPTRKPVPASNIPRMIDGHNTRYEQSWKTTFNITKKNLEVIW